MTVKTTIVQGMTWQPIETAPEMRTIFLFAITDMADDGTVLNWKMGSGFYHTGWTSVEDKGYSPWEWEGRHVAPWEALPTHWMHLPEPPQ